MSTISSRFENSPLGTGLNLRFGRGSRRVSGKDTSWIETLIQRSIQRRQLMEMDDIQLIDMGISRAEAEREARKPIWRA